MHFKYECSATSRIRIIVCCALLLTAMVGVQAQDLDHFQGIKSQGPIPNDLRKSLSDIYMQDQQRVRDYNDGKLSNRDNVLESSYQVNKLMVSGRILYGDPLTQMVNHIADTLLKDYPELRRELRFYVVKSPEVNAFATGQGIVFVNTGLIAQVQDEAQLAFVISHEVIHYFKRHNIEMLVNKNDTVRDNAHAEDKELHDFLKYHNRSHAMENEADSLGLKMFYINSPYDKNVADGFFDVLQYGYLPFDEVPFDTNYFDTPYYHLPAGLFLNEVAPITARDDYDDSKSTHPNLLKRRKRTSQLLSRYSGGDFFVVTTEEQFHSLQTLARFECVRQELIFADYAAAFYDIYLLEREYPNNAFLIKAKAQSLYSLSRWKNYANSTDVVPYYKDFEGEVQQIYYMLRKINNKDLAILATREVWKAHCLYPEDKQLTTMAENLLTDLHLKNRYIDNDFKADYDTTVAKMQPVDTTVTRNQKYSRIRHKKQVQQIADANSFAFTDFMMGNDDFATTMHQCFKRDSVSENRVDYKPRKNLFFYAPSYYIFNNKGDLKIRKSDKRENRLNSDMEMVAQNNGMGLIDFSDNALRNHTDAQFYNEFVTLNEWCNEFSQTSEHYDRCFYMQPQMDSMIQKYDANTLQLTLVVNEEGVSSMRYYYYAMLYALLWPTTPLSGYYCLFNHEETHVFCATIDAQNGHILQKTNHTSGWADPRSKVCSIQYDNLHQMLRTNDTMTSRARVPGYLGRRWSFTAGLNMNNTIFSMYPVLTLAFVENYFVGMGDLEVHSPTVVEGVKVFPCLDVEYAMGRKWGIALDGSYSNVAVNMQRSGLEADTYQDRTYSFGLTARHYKRDAIAPIGNYVGMGCSMTHFDFFNAAKSPVAEDLHRNFFGLRFEGGRNIIYLDRLIVNFGIQYNITLSNPLEDIDMAEFFDPVLPDWCAKETKFRTAMASNLWFGSCVVFNLRIGILPF